MPALKLSDYLLYKLLRNFRKLADFKRVYADSALARLDLAGVWILAQESDVSNPKSDEN